MADQTLTLETALANFLFYTEDDNRQISVFQSSIEITGGQIALFRQWFATLWQSQTFRAKIADLVAQGPVFVSGADFSRIGVRADAQAGGRLISIDFSEIGRIAYVNSKGVVITSRPELVLAHELIHLGADRNSDGPPDPDALDNEALNGLPAFDYDGPAVDFQNQVAREIPSFGEDSTRVSYYSAFFDDFVGTGSPDFYLDVGDQLAKNPIDASETRSIDIVRFGGVTGGSFLPLVTSNDSDTIDTSVRQDASNDLLLGFGGGDTLRSGDGNDVLRGFTGDDTLEGGEGSDLLFGGEDKDRLDGGTGNDVIIAGDDDDTIVGGRGQDFIDGDGDSPRLTALGLGDNDTLTYADADFHVVIKFAEGGLTQNGQGNKSSLTIINREDEGDEVVGTDTVQNVEKVIGTSFADLIQLDSNTRLGDLTNVEIDLGSDSSSPNVLDTISARGFGGQLKFDLRDKSNQTISGGSLLLEVKGVSAAVGTTGGDEFFGGRLLIGGNGPDKFFANSDTRLIFTDTRTDEGMIIDNSRDEVTLVGESVKVYAANNDFITGDLTNAQIIRVEESAPETTEISGTGPIFGALLPIKFEIPNFGVLLTGGKEEEEDSKIYIAADDTTYSLSGNSLFVDYGSGAISIENFSNGDAGIRLIDAEPDNDDAEEQRDPLIIDLDGDRNVVTALEDSRAYFDLDNDGFAERVAWSRATDGFLVRDLNGNGTIDNGSEMFGTGQVDAVEGRATRSGEDGFIELALLDSNGDGVISAADVEFETLRVWVDANLDAQTDEGELRLLSELGIVSISLETRPADHVQPESRNIADLGSFIDRAASVAFDDGSSQSVYDVYLSIDQYDAREVFEEDLDLSGLADLPNILGTGTLSDLNVAMSRDPGLEELVREFANLDISQAGEIHERVQQIIFRWTGADAVDAESRGPNINGKWLHVIEQITGKPFVQARIGSNPRVDAASLLIEEWSTFLDRTTGKLLGETALGAQLLPGVGFFAGAFFEVEDGVTIEHVLASAADAAPSGDGEKIAYWKAINGTLQQYQSGFGLTDEQFDAAFQVVIAAQGLPLNAASLRDALIIGDASETGANSLETTINGIAYPGDRILVANAEEMTLSLSARNDRIIVTDAVQSLKFTGSELGGDRLDLIGWSRESLTVTSEVLSVQEAAEGFAAGGFVSANVLVRFESEGRTIEIRPRITSTGVYSHIDTIQFSDGSVVPLLELLGSTDALVFGEGGETFEFLSEAGGQFIFGQTDADIYSVDANSGDDFIVEETDDRSGSDVLRIDATIDQVDLSVSGQLGRNLTLSIAGGGSATIGSQFSETATRIETFEFSDGLILSADEIKERLLTGTSSSEALLGTFLDDTIDGGGGGDTLEGGRGNDRYVIREGYGETTVRDVFGQSTIAFDYSVTEDQLEFLFSGRDFTITDETNGNRVVLDRDQAFSTVVELDGTVINIASILVGEALLAGTTTGNTIYGTAANDFITGTDDADLIVGFGGDDSLRGGEGNDTYQVSSGNIGITDAAFGFDTIQVDGPFTLDDLQFVESTPGFRRMRLRIGDNLFISLANDAESQTGAAIPSEADVESIVFSDGSTFDLASGQVIDGTDGDDILFSYASTGQTFTPGAGNDRIFSLNGRHDVLLTEGFGHDEYYDRRVDNNDFIFSGIEFNSDIEFRREGVDLVVSVTPDDSLTFKDVFTPLAPTFRNGFLRFSNTSLSLATVVENLAQPTDGDDLLFGRADLNGGAGNDILIGSRDVNNYTFGRGFGHDVIKEQDGTFGNEDEIDTLTLEGLNREDVSFSRSAADPLSVVITINDTGETLTLDGTPYDDFDITDNAGAHWIERIIFADGSELAQRDVEQLIHDSERTDGADTLHNFGRPSSSFAGDDGAVLDGGAGDDTYINPFRDINVRMSAGQGSDRIVNLADDRITVFVELDGLELSDLAVFDEIRDGQQVYVLRARTGEELVVNGSFDAVTGGGPRFAITDAAGAQTSLVGAGAIVDDNASTDEVDFLNGQFVNNGGEVIESTTVFDEDFTPGAGDDAIFGRGGQDTIFMEVGDGQDTLVGNSVPFGEPGFPSQSGENGYIVRLGEGFAVADFSFSWLTDGSERVSLSFNDLGDGVIVEAAAIDSVVYADGTTLEFSTLLSSGTVLLPPSTTTVSNSSEDETFVASNGGVRLQLRGFSGNDTFIDQFLSDGVAEVDPEERGWTSNRIDLREGTSLDDFEFVQDTSSPNDLIVRNLVSGASIRVVGQIQEIPQGDDLWTDVGLRPDGTPDWSGFNLGFYDTDGDGRVNWNDPDVDGDGNADWFSVNEATLDIDGDGQIDLFAFDDNEDGIYDAFDLVLDDGGIIIDPGPIIPIGPGPIIPIGPGISPVVSFFDTDGDNVVDSYGDPNGDPVALPTNPDGSVDWASFDLNMDGESDIAKIDLDGDGTPDWDNPDLDGDGTADWEVEAYDEFFNELGFVTRTIDPETGQFFYQIENGPEVLLARDTDNDGLPDQFAFDQNFDGEPDQPETPVVVDTFRLFTPTGTNSFSVTSLDWSELTDRIIQRNEGDLNPAIVINLDEERPQATPGNDTLLVRSNETVDGLAGNDTLLLVGSNVTVSFGQGSGNDTVRARGTDGHTLDLSDTASLAEIEVLESSNGRDMVVRLRSTGETVRIENQIDFEGQEPPVGTFRLADGSIFSWQILLGLVSGVSTEGEVTVSTDAGGGNLDGGAGNDQLLGGTGDDVYDFGRGYDEDTIRDAGGSDTVRFGEGISIGDLSFTRAGADGDDLLVEVAGRERLAFTITGQFGDVASRIESFELADGTVLDWFDVQSLVLSQATSASDDSIRGFASADVIDGGSGNDELQGEGGNDLIDGGRGRDTAVFRGSQDQYEITVDGDRVTVRDLTADRDGTDTLFNVEEISFLGDGSRVLLVPENSVPVAGDLAFGVNEDATLIIDRSVLLAAASDADGDAIELGALTDATNGDAWVGSDGNIRFRPNANFAGDAGFTFAVEDGNGGIGTARVAVAVAAQNDAPLIAIDDRQFISVEDDAIDWRLPTGFASDIDGDALTLTARLQSGDALPSWLVFDGEGFTGTPPVDFNGAIEIELVADDGSVSTSVPLSLDILPLNDAPKLASAPSDISLTPGEAFAFTLPVDTFVDPEGDPITYQILAASGEPLPDWITVDGLSVSGTAPEVFEEPLQIAVIADDGSAANLVEFSILPLANAAPEIAVPLAPVSSDEDVAIDYVIPADTFTDADGDTLTLTASLADGSDLPAWLSFDGERLTGTPPADFNGVIGIAITATDGFDQVSDTFDLTIEAFNDTPVLVTPLSDVSSVEDAPFAFAVDTGTFADVDGDTLTLTATLADGSDLPTWISFDGVSFTGVPPQDFNGSVELEVTASDGELSVSDTLVLTINPLNDPPVLLQPLADQSGNEDVPIVFAIPDGTFADVDGDTLTLSATLADGTELPDWLSFDGMEFAGTPPQDFNGFLDVTVSATDGEASVSDSFRITIDPVNDAPVLVEALADVNSAEDTAFSVEIPFETFADVDGDTLVLSATLADGTELPDWLSFDGMEFAGTPPQDFNGALNLSVAASDGEVSVSSDFTLTIDPVNDAPVLSQGLVDQSASGNASVEFVVPSDSFTDVDGDTLSYSVSLSDGSQLPDWLAFDAASRSFTGTAPNADASFEIRVTASDGQLSAFGDFTLNIDAVDTGGGSSSGFTFVNLNSWYNPAWGGGYNVTFEYEVQPEAIIDGELRAWDILAGYSGPGSIVTGWVNGFPGPASFAIDDNGAVFSTVGQGYQPDLQVGQKFRISIQVNGAPYSPGDFGFEIFDRDPAFNLADETDSVLTVNPTDDWGSGLTQNVQLTNTSSVPIDDWRVVLDVPEGIIFDITNVWGATATELSNGDVLFEAVGYNQEIAPNAQANFGFNASYSGTDGVDFTANDFSFAEIDAQQYGGAQQSVTSVGTSIERAELFDLIRSPSASSTAELFDLFDPAVQGQPDRIGSLLNVAPANEGAALWPSRGYDPSSTYYAMVPQDGLGIPAREEYRWTVGTVEQTDGVNAISGDARRAHVMPSTVALLSAVETDGIESSVQDADAQLARKMAIIRQDLSMFGANNSAEFERYYGENAEHLQLYA